MMERISKKLFLPEMSMQARMFVVGGMVGSVLMTCLFFFLLLSGRSLMVASALGISALVLITATAFCMYTKRYTLGSAVVIFVLNGIVTPLGYFTSGGAESGSPAWFVVCGMFVFVLFKGKLMWFFLVFSIGVFGAISAISASRPELVSLLEGGYAGVAWDTFFAASGACILAGIVLRVQEVMFERQNEMVKQQKAEIEKLNASQNRFFSSMSHEIRTPINTIIGLNEITLREQNLPQEIADNANGIQNASRMLLNLINDLLDLSRIQSGNMKVSEAQYETARMLSEIVNLLWNRAKEKGLRFDLNVGESIPSMLYGDEIRVKQVVVNLLTNAIKYTSEGRVLLNVGGEKTDANRFLLRIDVEDTGVGIRKEAIPYLFDSFKRVDEQDHKTIEGTGLGLSIAKQLTEMMGGTISVDSIYMKGSSFHVAIPQQIMDESPLNQSQISTSAGGVRTAYRQIFEAPEARILIVDDNEMNRVVTGKLLRSTLVQTDFAASGEECLQMTAQNRYDVIFMDHEMPGMDGVEALSHVRNQQNGLCRETPVVALTANAGSDRSRFYTERGFQAYLAKPIHSSLLEATLMQLLPGNLVEKTSSAAPEQTIYVGRQIRKKTVMITTDCLCDLPEEIVNAHGVKLMPFYLMTEEGRFRDMTEIDADNLIRYIADGDKNIKTQPGSIEEYEAFFAEALTEAEHVVHLSLGKSFDKGYDYARRASESFGNVHVVDTGQISSGLGMVVLHACEEAMQGKSAEDIARNAVRYAERVQMSFLVPDPASMQTHKQAAVPVILLSKALNLEPVFVVKNGKIRLKTFFSGSLEDTPERFIRRTLRRKRNADLSGLYIAYSGFSVRERTKIAKDAAKYGGFEKVVMQKASATISANCGLRSFSLTYALKTP